MKQFMKQLPILLMILTPCFALGQVTKSSENRRIQFAGSSDTETITVYVLEKTSEMMISVRSSIKEGKLMVEVYDPSGEKQGQFFIESQVQSNDKKHEIVSGTFNKSVVSPATGQWKIKLIPNQAHGSVSFSCSKISE